MRIVRPVTVTSTMVTSNVDESTLDTYNAGTEYSTGNQVKYALGSGMFAEYESAVDGNTGNTPPDNPDKWIELGYSNKWQMFDKKGGTATAEEDLIDVTVNSSRTDAVGLYRLVASSVTLTLEYDGDVKKTETIDLRVIPQPGWFNWLYSEYEYKENIIWIYPRYVGSTLQVEITSQAVGEDAECGQMAWGPYVNLGLTQFGPRIGITDYSIKDTDQWGNTYLSQGSYTDELNIQVVLYNEQIDRVKRVLSQVRGLEVIFDCNESQTDYDAMTIYGFYQNFDVTVPGPTVSQCNIEIKGL